MGGALNVDTSLHNIVPHLFTRKRARVCVAVA